MPTGMSLYNVRCQLEFTYSSKISYMAVEIIARITRGILANAVEIVMKLVQTEYILNALALGVVKAIATTKNLPQPPAPEITAAMRPPTSLPFPRPSFHAGTWRAAAV